MRHVVHDKYFLKDLLREIDLYDRKLEHLRHHENFESTEERDKAVRTATTRRDNLNAKARMLMEEGIEYDEADLPRSMMTPEQLQRRHTDPVPITESRNPVADTMPPSEVAASPAAEPETQESIAAAQTEFGAAIARLQQQAKTAGMPRVGWQEELLDYKRKRNKIPA